MRADSPFRYHLLVGDRQLGPYDRKTIVGMRIKKLIDDNLKVRRSDSHVMSVAQLVADRFEMADAESLHKHEVSPPASGIWPTFLMDCGGNFMKPGAFGFVGKGELRFQGDFLRLTANRKSGFMSTKQDRIKLPLQAIAAAYALEGQEKVLALRFKADQLIDGLTAHPPVQVQLDDGYAVKELLELMNLKPASPSAAASDVDLQL
jgi:hypothetical protein